MEISLVLSLFTKLMLMVFDACKYETQLSGIDPEINQRVTGLGLRLCLSYIVYVS